MDSVPTTPDSEVTPTATSGNEVHPGIALLYDAQTIENRIVAVGGRIRRELLDHDPLFVSIMGDSVVFLADLIRAIEQPIRFEFVQVHYTASSRDDQILNIHYPISLSVADQTIVIVKDVVASGVIETYLRNQFLDRGASQVFLSALIDLEEERTTDIEVDFRLFAPKSNAAFVGYGLKHRGRYGNLPYIGRREID